MKKFSTTIFYVSIIILVSGCTLFGGGVKEKKTTSVVTVDKRIEPIGSFPVLLEETINTIRSSDQIDNFILFVHGRGKHPGKAFEKELISGLESNYSAKVIMFHWGPSWAGPTGIPMDSAEASSIDFGIVLKELEKYKQENPALVEDIKFTLLSHSMGSIVLETLLKSTSALPIGKLFDTVVVSSPMSAGKNHSGWVERISFSDNVYITVNNEDSILGGAGAKLKRRCLGKGLSSRSGEKFNLANNAKYIDVSEISLGHRYYLNKDLKKNKSFFVKTFFGNALNGNSALLNKDNGVKDIRRERVYVLRKP